MTEQAHGIIREVNSNNNSEEISYCILEVHYGNLGLLRILLSISICAFYRVLPRLGGDEQVGLAVSSATQHTDQIRYICPALKTFRAIKTLISSLFNLQ